METFPLLLNQSDNLHENDYGEDEVDGHHHDEAFSLLVNQSEQQVNGGYHYNDEVVGEDGDENLL